MQCAAAAVHNKSWKIYFACILFFLFLINIINSLRTTSRSVVGWSALTFVIHHCVPKIIYIYMYSTTTTILYVQKKEKSIKYFIILYLENFISCSHKNAWRTLMLFANIPQMNEIRGWVGWLFVWCAQKISRRIQNYFIRYSWTSGAAAENL